MKPKFYWAIATLFLSSGLFGCNNDSAALAAQANSICQDLAEYKICLNRLDPSEPAAVSVTDCSASLQSKCTVDDVAKINTYLQCAFANCQASSTAAEFTAKNQSICGGALNLSATCLGYEPFSPDAPPSEANLSSCAQGNFCGFTSDCCQGSTCDWFTCTP